MSGKAAEQLEEKIKQLGIESKSGHEYLAKLILDGFFDTPVLGADIVLGVREKFGDVWKPSYPHVYSKKFLKAGILRAVNFNGTYYWVLSTVPKEEALRQIKKGKKIIDIEEGLFSEGLMKKLEKDFKHELAELHDNFGKNGNATAFLLRKIFWKSSSSLFSQKMGRRSCLRTKSDQAVGLA